MLATEKVTRKSLDDADHKRLVEEALAEVDFSALAGKRGREQLMEEIARVYADALFEAAQDADRLDEVHEQLDEFADAMNESHDMRVFFFSPYFSSAEKREAIAAAIAGASDELVNFLELLAEKHRMPAIFAIRRRFDELWAEEREAARGDADERGRARRGASSSRSARRSSARPTVRSTSRPRSTRRSSAASCCGSATWSSTRACAASWKD